MLESQGVEFHILIAFLAGCIKLSHVPDLAWRFPIPVLDGNVGRLIVKLLLMREGKELCLFFNLRFGSDVHIWVSFTVKVTLMGFPSMHQRRILGLFCTFPIDDWFCIVTLT